MKKFLCIFIAISLVFVSFFSLSCSAIGVDTIIDFGLDFLKSELSTELDNIKNMSGDEFYNFMASEESLNSLYSKALNWSMNNNAYPLISSFLTGSSDPVFDALGLMEEAHYNCAMLEKSQLEELTDIGAIVLAGTIEEYYTNFSDLSITTANNVITTSTKAWPGVMPYPYGTPNQDIGFIEFDIGDIPDYSHTVQLYPGGLFPPCMYVGSACTVYQDGVRLPSDYCYWIIGDNLLLRSHGIDSIAETIMFDYGGNSASLENIRLHIYNGRPDSNDVWNYVRYTTNDPYCYQSGSILCEVGIDVTADTYLSLLKLWAKHVIYLDEPPSNTLELPSNIPYDDHDKVVVAVNVDNSVGDVVYIAPDTYNQLINNGTIVEGDYINNYSTTTNNDIHNTYNEYLINNYYNNNSGSGGVSYDDTQLLLKLNDIIDKLNLMNSGQTFDSSQIENILSDLCFDLDNVVDGLTSIETLIKGIGIIDDLTDPDSDSPFKVPDDWLDDQLPNFELDWKSLIEAKLPIFATIEAAIDGFDDTNQELTISVNHPLWWLSSEADEALPTFSIDFSWYTRGFDANELTSYAVPNGTISARSIIRDLLACVVYIFALKAGYDKTKEVISGW